MMSMGTTANGGESSEGVTNDAGITDVDSHARNNGFSDEVDADAPKPQMGTLNKN
jgi:hypothetical protein